MSEAVLRILMVEDKEADAILVQRELRRQGLAATVRRVDRDEALVRALHEFAPDLVLSDLSLPGFSGLEALAIVRKERPGVPLIFVSGTVDEDQAVELLKLGATDYVLKDNLARLPASVQRALREVQFENEHVRLEEQHRAILEKMEAQASGAQPSPSRGVAHDLNNVLAPISMAIAMLRAGLPEPERERMYAIIEQCAGRATEITRGALQKPAAAPAGRRAGAGGECILLVDDEETIRFAASAVLARHGYRVLTATDGAEALRLFEAHASEIALVLTDVMMPVMNGLALVRALKKIRPEVPIIASSGQNEEARQAELLEAGVGAVLGKPYAADSLVNTVDAALAGRGK